jgi:ketol-acid reductoisomerase
MVAPKGPGHLVRSEYNRGAVFRVFWQCNQDVAGDYTEISACLYASAIGGGQGDA